MDDYKTASFLELYLQLLNWSAIVHFIWKSSILFLSATELYHFFKYWWCKSMHYKANKKGMQY